MQRYLATRRQQGVELGLLLCGDFNSQADSAVYKFLSEGYISESHPELEGLESSVLPDCKRITHSLALASAMAVSGQGEPEFTNYTVAFRGALDYIWYTPSELKVESVLSLPTEESILKSGHALPSAVQPSDHVMLCGNFSIFRYKANEELILIFVYLFTLFFLSLHAQFNEICLGARSSVVAARQASV